MPVPFRPQVLVVEDTRMGRQALNAGLVAGYRLRRTRANAPILLYAKPVPKPWPFAPSAFGTPPAVWAQPGRPGRPSAALPRRSVYHPGFFRRMLSRSGSASGSSGAIF